MKNDITRVIVHFHPESQERVQVKALHAFTDAMISYAAAIYRNIFHPDISIELSYATGPEHGSIIFSFVVEFQAVEGGVGYVGTFSQSVRDIIGLAAEISGIGAFAWVVAFGGKSLPEILKGGAAKRLEDATKENIELFLATVAATDAKTVAELRALKLRAGALGGSGVYIQMRDDPPVLLWSREERMQPELIGKYRNFSVTDLWHEVWVSRDGPSIAVQFNGRRMEAFLGTVQEAKSIPRDTGKRFHAIILWGSAAPSPKRGVGRKGLSLSAQSEVDAAVVKSSEEIIPLEPVPPEFEAVDIVAYVKSVITRQ